MKKHVVIVGAGFAGLELAARLSDSLADEVDVTLLDRNDAFYFGFSKLDVLLGRRAPSDVLLHYRDIAKEGVEFRQETVTAIDPLKRRVYTEEGCYDADYLAVALGAEYDMAATPGFREGGFEYYSLAGAERLSEALAEFTAGDGSDLGPRPSVQVPAGAVRGCVPAARPAHEAGSQGRRGHSDDLSDGGAGSGHQGGLADCSWPRSTSAGSSTRPRSWWWASTLASARPGWRVAGACRTTCSSGSPSTARLK